MPHQAGHTWGDLFSGAGDFLKDTGLIGGTLGGLVAGVGQEAMNRQAMERIEEMQKQAVTAVAGQPTFPSYEGGLLGEVGRQSQFKPFTVTGTNVFGQPSAATISQTGTELALSPEEAALQRSLTSFGQSAFDFLADPAAREAEQSALIGMLTQDPAQRAGREQELYNRLEGMQRPAREREQLELEERLFAQGRGGVRTAAYGGTPEQLAAQKAIEEQRAANTITAIEQARLEQALGSEQTLAGLSEFRQRAGLFGEIGLSAIPTAYTPQQELIRTLTPQLEASRLAATLQATGLGLGAGLAEAGLEAQLGYTDILGQLERQRYQGLFDLLRAERQAQTQAASGGSGMSGNLITNLYGMLDEAGIPRI
jgi:hypothetical protein